MCKNHQESCVDPWLHAGVIKYVPARKCGYVYKYILLSLKRYVSVNIKTNICEHTCENRYKYMSCLYIYMYAPGYRIRKLVHQDAHASKEMILRWCLPVALKYPLPRDLWMAPWKL